MSLPRLLAAALCLLIAPPLTHAFDMLPVYQFEISTLADDGRYAEALRPASNVVRIASQRGDTTMMAEAHQTLARLFIRVGRADSARAHAEAAVHLSNARGWRSLSAGSLFVLAEIMEAQGQADSAFASFQAAASAGNATGDSVFAGIALSVIGDRLLSHGLPEAALDRLDSAVALLATSHERAVRSFAHGTRARCFHRLRSYERACGEFEIAYELLTEDRTHKFTDTARLGVMERAAGDFFAEWQDAWLSRGRTISFQFRALGVAERGRAQALLDFVHPLDTLVTDSSGFMHPARSVGRRFGPGRDLAADVREALDAVLPPGSVLVYYSQLQDSLVVWVYKRGALVDLKAPFPTRWMESLAPFLPATTDTANAPPGLGGWWSRLMAQKGGPDWVYNIVAKTCFPDTLLPIIEGASELIIVPDGWLRQVPFAALLVGGKRLGLRLPLRYAPSLAMLEHIEQRGPGEGPATPAEVLVVGAPQHRRPLSGMTAEAIAVARLFGATPVLGAAATESLVTARWPHARVIHLATHGKGFADPDQALKSHLALDATPGFDGDLTAEEIQYQLPSSKADLVFLSACQTAFGASTRADATIGLPRALLAAGARTVVASTWRLNDASTSYLVQRFYSHLRYGADHPNVARALHRAMVETSRQPGWSDPYFWAGLQVVGGY